MRLTRRQLLTAVLAGTAAPAVAGIAALATTARSSRVFGRSVQKRALTVTTIGDPNAPKKILVVGIIHGNEQAGLKVLAQLKNATPPAGTALLLVDSVNPDGQHANTRQNARGVDLNRNFPYRWSKPGVQEFSARPHDVYYPGPKAASEPETRAIEALIAQEKPSVTIYYHQHLDVIDLSGGNAAIEKAYAKRVGMKATQLTRYGGSACTWADHVYPHGTAFVVELPASVSTAFAKKHATAVLALVADQAATLPKPAATTTPTPSTPTVSPTAATPSPSASGVQTITIPGG